MTKLDWTKASWNPLGTEPAFKKERSIEQYATRKESGPRSKGAGELFVMPRGAVQEARGAGVTIYFDGGCAPNPGTMSSCIVICRPGQKKQAHTIMNLGQGTNNIAEWSALLWAATWARDNGVQTCLFIGDSKLAIQQARGAWRTHDAMMASLREQFRAQVQGMNIELRHVLRDGNLAGVFLEHGRLEV